MAPVKTRLEPPDGGWGWVVAVASSCIFFITYGLLVSSGILMIALMDAFKTGRSQMSWIPITCFALSRLIAPLASYFSTRSSHRLVVFTGGLLITLGYALGFLAQTVLHFYLALGLTVGLGSGMVVFPTSILTTQYFTSHISLANGLYTGGASLGAIVGPLITEYLLKSLGLRFTFLLLGGGALHICVAASLFHPLKWHAKRVPVEPAKVVKSNGGHKVFPSAGEKPTVLTAAATDVHRQLKVSPVVLTRYARRQSSCVRTQYRSPFPRTTWNKDRNSLAIPNSVSSANLSRQVSAEIKEAWTEHEKNNVVKSADVEDGRRDSVNSSICPNVLSSQALERRPSRLSQILRQASIPTPDPVCRLPATDNGSVIHEEEFEEADDTQSTTVSDLHFLRLPIYYLMGTTASAFFLILNMTGIVIPDFAKDELEENISLDRAALLLSIISATDFFTRFCLSWVWDLRFINRTYCHLGACIFCGLSFCSFSMITTYNMALISCICIGLTSGISGVLVTVLFMQNIGPKEFGMSLSMSCLLSGVLMLGCGSFVGVLKDQTGSYKSTFLIVGSFTVIAAVTWLSAEICCFKRGKKDSTEQSANTNKN